LNGPGFGLIYHVLGLGPEGQVLGLCLRLCVLHSNTVIHHQHHHHHQYHRLFTWPSSAVPVTKTSIAFDTSARFTPLLNFIDKTRGCCLSHLQNTGVSRQQWTTVSSRQ